MSAESATTIVQQYFAAYENSDRAGIERLLAPEFRFTSPCDAGIGRARYMQRCWPNNEHIRRYHFRKLVADGGDVLVAYELEFDDGSRLRNAELFRIVDGRVREVEVYFGAFGEQATFDRGAHADRDPRREECA